MEKEKKDKIYINKLNGNKYSITFVPYDGVIFSSPCTYSNLEQVNENIDEYKQKKRHNANRTFDVIESDL